MRVEPLPRLSRRLTAIAAATLLLAAAAPAHAYMGPGLGMGALGVALGVVGSILLGIVSVVWYPVKRLIRAIRRRRADSRAGTAEASPPGD